MRRVPGFVTLLVVASLPAMAQSPPGFGPGPLPSIASDGSGATAAAFGNLVAAATVASARTSLGLGTGSSPTFAGVTLGAGTGGTSVIMNADSSGAGNGGAIYFQNAGSISAAVGQYSKITGGGYDASLALYGGGLGIRALTNSTFAIRNATDSADQPFSSGSATFSGTITNSGISTGTPVASVCLDASNNIIKKTTAGSCT